MKQARVLIGATWLALVGCAGGGDGGTEPVNEPPTITFTFPSVGVAKGIPVDLTVSVEDADDDPLTLTWTATRNNSFIAQNPQRTEMRWSTPTTVGTDTIRVTVSDGTASRSVTAEIRVGTPASAAINFIKANSPYIVQMLTPGDPRITIAWNQTVTIEAGTELLIATGGGFFNVLGTFRAHGTESEPIIFRPNARSLTCPSGAGWWDGIRAASDDAQSSDGFIDFEHVQVRFAQNGVRLRDNARALLQDCRIVCSSSAGVLLEGNGSLRAFDSEVSNGVQDGIVIAAITSLPDSVRITGCKLTINGNAGIRMDLQDAGAVTPIIVEFNEIEFNGSHGISLANAVFPSIHFNLFRGNGDETVSNLFLQGGYPGGADVDTLNVTCNFWGSAAASQATIDASIRDSLDTGTVGTRVDSNPWLNVSPITTPPNCTP